MALLYRMGTGNGSGGDLKPFIINFTCDSGFIGKTVTMEFQGTPHAGETVDNVSGTVASDGTLTLYPMHDGLWKYYATSDVSGYHEEIITLEKWGNYSVELFDTPNGATVTPTDDVQTWLHCANVSNKSYTTISEVVADTTTLNTLIANENANDYLVRSTTWASDVCSNESAMTYIGLNDYCANKLLADSTWFEAICNSTYFKRVLNVKVPTMTEPSDKAFYDSDVSDGFRTEPYLAFDNNLTTTASHGENINTPKNYIGYDFGKNVVIKKVYIKNYNRVSSAKIIASDDKTKWVDISESFSTPIDTEINHNINNNKGYRYYALYPTSYAIKRMVFYELQFYGREEV